MIRTRKQKKDKRKHNQEDVTEGPKDDGEEVVVQKEAEEKPEQIDSSQKKEVQEESKQEQFSDDAVDDWENEDIDAIVDKVIHDDKHVAVPDKNEDEDVVDIKENTGMIKQKHKP